MTTDAKEVIKGAGVIVRAVVLANLTMPNRRLRKHALDKLAKIQDSIKEFGFLVPLVVDRDEQLIAGELRYQAALNLGMTEAPAVLADHLSPAQVRAYRIADNKLAEGSSWNLDALGDEFRHLLTLDFDPSKTGFAPEAIEGILSKQLAVESAPVAVAQTSYLRRSDLFAAASHWVMCGDSLNAADVACLMRGDKADFSINDMPYNAKIEGFVSTRKGGRAHREFEMASGEMTPAEFLAFLLAVFVTLKSHCRPGAVIEAFIDWRNVHRLIAAAEEAGLDYLNLVCWVKNTAGMGSLFRSQHELVGVFRAPGAAHTNRVQLGKHGRHRTNVWTYDGYSGFGADRKKDLDRHPTPKNVQMIQDAILDVTKKHDIVLDLFGGGGTTMIAAERVGRSARLMEIDPRYCEASLRRFQEETGQAAIHAETGLTLDELIAERERAGRKALPKRLLALPAPESAGGGQ